MPMATKRAEAEVFELSDVRMRKVGPEKWNAELVTVRAVPVVKVLEPGVSLALARTACKLWRAKSDPINKGLTADDLDAETARFNTQAKK